MDMIEYLQSRGVEFVSVGDGIKDKHIGKGWYQCACPICGGKHRWLGYNIKKGYFNCYNHGHSSSYALFKAWFPYEDVGSILRGLESPVPLSEGVEEEKGFYIPPLYPVPISESRAHIDYILSRGLDPKELADKWGVMALTKQSEYKYRDRLFIPVFDEMSNPVSWLTRSIDENAVTRYLTAPKDRELYPIKNQLFGQHLIDKTKPVIVVEGAFDAFAVGENVVATLGKKLTTRQKGLLLRYTKIVLCFDNEDDTQEQAQELMSEFSIFGSEKMVYTIRLDAPDPGSASKKEIADLLDCVSRL